MWEDLGRKEAGPFGGVDRSLFSTEESDTTEQFSLSQGASMF